jgi:hypothetical protein
MKVKNQKGFSALIILLIIVLLGVVSAAGWYIWSQNRTDKNDSAATTSGVTPTPTPAPCTDGYTQYTNTTYGIKFCYPTAWGSVSSQPDFEMQWGHVIAGSGIELSFSDEPMASAAIRSKDWTHDPNMGHGGSDSALSYSPLQTDANYNHEGRYTHNVISNTASEYFMLAPLCSEGGCHGMGLILVRTLSDNDNTYGIAFAYNPNIETNLDAFEMTQEQIDALPWDENFPESLINQFQTISSSVSNL